MDLTELVRGPLTGQERMTLGALITIDVHARDIVAELVQGNVKDVSRAGGDCNCVAVCGPSRAA
jgi:dynein heavy chain